MSRYEYDPRGVTQLKPRRWYDTRPAAIAFLAGTITATGIALYAAGWCLHWYIKVQVSR